VEVYHSHVAKLRLIKMDIKISSECGQLTLLERDAEESVRPAGAGGARAGARSDVGVILKVPLPEFDIRGNASLVLALGGLQGYSVNWVSQGEARINDVPVALPDSIIFCIFRMPRDGAAGKDSMQSLWLSPSILDFVKDIQGLRRKHLKPFRSKRRNKDQNPPDPPAPAAPHPAAPHPAAPPPNTLPALRRHDAESTALAPSSNALQDWRERGEEAPQLESAEAVAASGVENEAAPQAGACVICCDRPADFLVTPCGHQCGCQECLDLVVQRTGTCPICRTRISSLQRVFRVVGPGETHLGSGGADGAARGVRAGAGRGGAGAARAQAQASSAVSSAVLMGDVIYSMRWQALEFKLSGDGTADIEAREVSREENLHADGEARSVHDMLARLSAQMLDVTAIISRNEQLGPASSLARTVSSSSQPSLQSPGATADMWFSSVAVRLEKLSLGLLAGEGGIGGAGPGGGSLEGGGQERGFVELRDLSMAITSKMTRGHAALTQTSVLGFVRTIDSHLNLRSVGKGSALLEAWIPRARGKVGKGSRGWAASRQQVGSPPPGLASGAGAWGETSHDDKTLEAQKRHVRITCVLGRVQLHLEHPLGTTHCSLRHVNDRSPLQPRELASSRAPGRPMGAGRRGGGAVRDFGAPERLYLCCVCGFEVRRLAVRVHA